MANDIDKTSPHYKGDFGSIYEVNKKFPTGGVAGDFVVIEGWAHYWNADRATWCVNAQRDSYWDELITNIIEKFKLVRGATYMGVASLDTVPAKAIGAKMYYFATVAGTYKNFGDLVVPQGINVLYSENGSSWVNTTLLEVAQELGVSTNKVVSQKALNDALLKKFDKESVVQESGEAEDKVMSQKAVSDKLSGLENEINVYDCSHNGEIKFNSLKDALMSVPQKFRKGGITLKYCTTDNKYKYYTLTNKYFDVENYDILKLFDNAKESVSSLKREIDYIKDSLIKNLVELEQTPSEILEGTLNRDGSINKENTNYRIKIYDVSENDIIHIVGTSFNVSSQAIVSFYSEGELNKNNFISNIVLYEIYGSSYSGGKVINIDKIIKIGEHVVTSGTKKVAIMVDSKYDINLNKVSDITYNFDQTNLETKIENNKVEIENNKAEIEDKIFSFQERRNNSVSLINGDFDNDGNIVSSSLYHIKTYSLDNFDSVKIKGSSFNVAGKILIALYNGKVSKDTLVFYWRHMYFNNNETWQGGKIINFELNINLKDNRYKEATTLAVLEKVSNDTYNSTEYFYKNLFEYKSKLYGKTLWTLCDSLGASNVWQKRLSEITGIVFDADLNNLPSAPISVGGTRSNPNSASGGQQRAKNLVSYVGKKNIDIVIYECINDLYNVTGFDGNVGNIEDAPFFRKKDIPIIPETHCTTYTEAKQYFENNISTIVSNIPTSERETGLMVNITYGNNVDKRYGAEIEITSKASSSGTIMVRAGGTRNYISVTPEMTIDDIINSIINYSFGTGWEAIKISNSKVRIVFFQENIYGVEVQTNNTGITYTMKDCGNIFLYYRYYFGDSTEESILNCANWKEYVSQYSIYKGLIQYLTTNLPMSEIYFMFPNTLWASDKNTDLLDSNSKFSYDLYMKSTRTKAYKEIKKIQKEVCDYYSIPFLDVENNSLINWFNRLLYYNNGDIHPKDEGYYMWAECIKKLLL